jgi:uncharacterized membrane protein
LHSVAAQTSYEAKSLPMRQEEIREAGEMYIRVCAGFVGIVIGTFLMVLGRSRDAPKELRTVGGLILIASFSYLLGVEMAGTTFPVHSSP